MTLMDVAGPAGSLHVDDGGSGDLAVVFVHAFGGNTTHWSAQLEHPRKKRRTVALDPGTRAFAATGRWPI